MGFFENAYDFEVTGGSFYDIRGDQINRTNDNSMRIGGTGNKTNISPNLSRQDNRAYNQESTTYRSQMDSQYSTHSNAPPAPGMQPQANPPPGQPAMDSQLYDQWVQWMEFKRWQEWQQFQQQQQQQQQQQYQYQYQYQYQHQYQQHQHQQQQQYSQQAPPAAQSHEPAGHQQQPSQATPTTPQQSHPSQNTSTNAQPPLLEGEDPAVHDLGNQFQRQRISEEAEYEYAYARGRTQSSTTNNTNFANF